MRHFCHSHPPNENKIRDKYNTARHSLSLDTKASNSDVSTGLILGLCPANERRRYFVTPSLIGWTQTWSWV